MFSISSNGIIQISRGDTCYGNLFINIGTELEPEPYQLREEDTLYFGVMEANSSFKNALLCKRLTKKDKTPGIPPVVGESLSVNAPGEYGVIYYTRTESDEGKGYLNDGTYRYDPVETIPEQHPAGVYFPLISLGEDYIGYYVINFESRDTECLVPGLYYYEAKLARLEPTATDPEHYRVDTIVPKTKFIIHD